MNRLLLSAAAVAAIAFVTQGCACDCGCDRPARPAKPVARDVSRDPVGTTFTFDEGDGATLDVTWLAADRIHWKAHNAPPGMVSDGGLAKDGSPVDGEGENDVAVAELRRGVSFVRWRTDRYLPQLDNVTRLQVIDLGAGRAVTTLVVPRVDEAGPGRVVHSAGTVRPKAGPAPTAGSPTDLTGRTFTLDLGADAATRVTFAAKDRLAFEELRGATKGARGEAALESSEVRPGLVFVRWRDGDRLVAAVLDLDLRRVVRTVVTRAALEHGEGALLDADS